MPPTSNEQPARKRVKDETLEAAAESPTSPQSYARSAGGAVRRNRKQSRQQGASGRSHEENQERAYIAASRRSDRSIEARLESARRASEIHKKRCGRGLKVTEEAVMNEEMYEEEDPGYELRVNRLRMLMNFPPIGYHPYQWPLMPFNATSTDGGNSTPTTPAATPFQTPQLIQPVSSPTTGFMFPHSFAVPHMAGMNQNSMSPVSPAAHSFPGQVSQMTPTMANLQTPSTPSTPAAHFLPPTRFSPQAERQETIISLQPTKPDEPIQIEIPEHEVVLDQAPLDLSLNYDGLNELSTGLWENSETFNMEEWVSQGL